MPLTEPKSPAITKTTKKVIDENEDLDSDCMKKPKLKPVEFTAVLPHRKVIPEMVHLPGDDISKRKLEQFHAKLERETAEQIEKRKFQAQPIMTFDQKALVHVEKRPLTEPEPFKLLSEVKHKQFIEKLKEKQMKEEEEKENLRRFKAAPLANNEVFVPKKSTKPLTQYEEPKFKLEERLAQRHKFDEEIRKKEQKLKEEKENQEQAKKEQELREISELRKKLVHKATPIRVLPGITIAPSKRPLTEPKSPKFATRRRRQE